jgi:hypothetical protein
MLRTSGGARNFRLWGQYSPKIYGFYLYYAIVPNIISGSYIYYVMSLFPLIIKNSAIISVQLEKVIKIALKIEMII